MVIADGEHTCAMDIPPGSQLTWLFQQSGFDHATADMAEVVLPGNPYQQLFNTPSDPSPASSSHFFPGFNQSGLASNSSKKRRRTAKEEEELRSLTQSDSSAAHAALQITTVVEHGHALRGIDPLSASASNCFAMSPLGQCPADYYRKPFTFGTFSVQIFDSSETPNEDVYRDVGTFSRYSGRSIHLIVTQLPRLDDVRQLDIGFALIVACRKVHGIWQSVCLVSFESSVEHKTRARTTDIAFRGNLEHCTNENGRRIWGQRSSHVRRSQKPESFKPLRLKPKGPVGLNIPEEFSFYVALFNADGFLLRHSNGSLCMAQTNAVRFEPGKGKKADGGTSALMREINKLSLFERADLSTLPSIPESLRTMLVTTDDAMLARLGLRTFTTHNKPANSIELSRLYEAYESDPCQSTEHAYRKRVRAVAFELGYRHADPGLTDCTPRFLSCGCTEAVEVRYLQIKQTGLDEAIDWLKQNGIHKPDMATIVARAELTGFLMRDLRFQSTWTISINNVYPDRILVDSKDEDKVHCLANTTYEADIALRDRMSSLARLAFCTKLKRDQLQDDILMPYCRGFLSRSSASTTAGSAEVGWGEDGKNLLSTQLGPPFSCWLVDRDKFEIVLHAYLMDFFMYWIRFRSVQSVRRLSERLLEDDKKLGHWFFQPGRLTHFTD